MTSRRPAMAKRAALATLLSLVAAPGLCRAQAAGGGTGASTPDAVQVNQIAPARERDRASPVGQIPATQGETAEIAQVPPDRVASDQGSPEGALGETDRPTPRRQLYDRVAEAWHILRTRGQQPTPELIAREIGPDNLTAFLNAFQGADAMFGMDSDTFPVPDRSGTHAEGSAPSPPSSDGKGA